MRAVELYGMQWSKVAQMLPGRTGQQCRERYCNVARPGLMEQIDRPWTQVERQTGRNDVFFLAAGKYGIPSDASTPCPCLLHLCLTRRRTKRCEKLRPHSALNGQMWRQPWQSAASLAPTIGVCDGENLRSSLGCVKSALLEARIFIIFSHRPFFILVSYQIIEPEAFEERLGERHRRQKLVMRNFSGATQRKHSRPAVDKVMAATQVRELNICGESEKSRWRKKRSKANFIFLLIFFAAGGSCWRAN